MTGGWGTPRVPVVQAIKEAADNYRQRYRESTYLPPYDVLTGRCSDGLHDDCHGHLLGVPCCCDCHNDYRETD